jgi:hypothetical protein
LKTLTEIVRAAPNVAQPYFTLSFIHENFFDDKARALGFLEVALSLKPNMPSETERAARLAEELGKEDVALRMYRAVRHLRCCIWRTCKRQALSLSLALRTEYQTRQEPVRRAEAHGRAV